MRSREERDEQALDIAGALFVGALVVAVGAGIVALGSSTFGSVDGRTLLVLIVAGLVAGGAYLARHRRR